MQTERIPKWTDKFLCFVDTDKEVGRALAARGRIPCGLPALPFQLIELELNLKGGAIRLLCVVCQRVSCLATNSAMAGIRSYLFGHRLLPLSLPDQAPGGGHHCWQFVRH